MTPEMKLAQFLSDEEEKQKLASEMSEKSVDDLEGLLKEALHPVAESVARGIGKTIGHVERNRGKYGLGAGLLVGKHMGHASESIQRDSYYDEKTDSWKPKKDKSWDRKGNPKNDWAMKHASEEKTANGDMLQYFQDHPEKLKEKQERDAKKEKKSSAEEKIARADQWGRELAQKEKTAETDTDRAKKYGRRGALIAGLGSAAESARRMATNPLLREAVKSQPGFAVATHGAGALLNAGLGYGAGRLAHRAIHGKSEGKQIEKKSFFEKQAISFNQANEGSKMLGRMSRLWEKHGPAIKNVAGKVGKGAIDTAKGVGSRIGNIKDPVARGAAIGAATGGVGGAVQGFLDPKENPMTGEKQRLRTAFRKGLAGAAAGAPTGALFGAMGKTSSVQRLEEALTKEALGLAGVGSMARNFVGQMKPVAQKAMAAAKPMAQNVMAKAAPMAQKALGGKTMGQAAGMGAAGGAALGAAKGLVAPGRDAQGQQKSRLGAMARGAAGGAVLGAGAGAGAKAALPHMVNAYKKVTPGLVHGAQNLSSEATRILPGR